MATTGIPSRKIGTSSPTSLPGDFSLGVGTLGYCSSPRSDPTCYTLDSTLITGTLVQSGHTYVLNPLYACGDLFDIARHEHFIKYGHKIIWYHGASDPGPPILETKLYTAQLAEQNRRLEQSSELLATLSGSGMDHCTGGPATDGFRLPYPAGQWVERRHAAGWGCFDRHELQCRDVSGGGKLHNKRLH